MTASPRSSFSFTKLVVDDLEKMASFYSEVYGLEQVQRIEAEIGGDPIDEIILRGPGEAGMGSLILLKFVDKPAPESRETILGFNTDDMDALFERIVAGGGAVYSPKRESSVGQVLVGFVTDPEGHLAEIVQPPR
jgi:predicted enzyme related to lactoylglutathione lyase